MKAKVSKPVSRKKNKGGRPRKHGKGTAGSSSLTWKPVSQPASTNHYEVSSQGQVRRLLKNGNYYDVKPWITGGPYAAVYIYGVKGATRNRKKVYVHRLVATHFVTGRKQGNVVHHIQGPANNTKSALEWVTPSENSKARKFFTDDGARKAKFVKPNKKVKVIVPPPSKPDKVVPAPKEKAKPVKVPAPPQKPVIKKVEPPKVTLPQKPQGKRLPDDPDGYYNAPSFGRKLKYLYKMWPPFKKLWTKFRKKHPDINQKNILAKFKEATGKGLEKRMGPSPASWNTRLTAALYEIDRRLET